MGGPVERLLGDEINAHLASCEQLCLVSSSPGLSIFCIYPIILSLACSFVMKRSLLTRELPELNQSSHPGSTYIWQINIPLRCTFYHPNKQTGRHLVSISSRVHLSSSITSFTLFPHLPEELLYTCLLFLQRKHTHIICTHACAHLIAHTFFNLSAGPQEAAPSGWIARMPRSTRIPDDHLLPTLCRTKTERAWPIRG
jgi:hypothetical protein